MFDVLLILFFAIFCDAHFYYKGNLGFWLGRIKTHDLVLIIEVTQRDVAQAVFSNFGSYEKISDCLGKSVGIKGKE